MGTADGMPSSAKTASGYQSAWAGGPGQVSMADIVRMGKPQIKASHAHHNIQDTSATEPFPHLRSHADHPSKVNQSEVSSDQLAPITDEWPVEQPAPGNAISVPEYVVDAELHPEGSRSSVSDGIDHHYEAEEVEEREDDNTGFSGGNDSNSISIPRRKLPEDDSRGSSLFENELYQNLASYQSEAPDYERHEGKIFFCFLVHLTEV